MSDTIEKEAAVLANRSTQQLGKREQTKANNREAIIAAAKEVFAELGYGATTVRDIIRNTGLASGTFYNYFKSKEEVFEALMDDSMARIRPRLRAERIRSATFEAYLNNALTVYFEYLLEDQASYRVMRRNTGALRVRMDTPEIIAGFEEIRTYIEEDITAGKLPKVDGEFLTAAIIGMASEIGEKLIQRENPDAAAAAEFAAHLILQGINGLPNKE